MFDIGHLKGVLSNVLRLAIPVSHPRLLIRFTQGRVDYGSSYFVFFFNFFFVTHKLRRPKARYDTLLSCFA